MSMTITAETIESFYNLIRNWDDASKKRLMNRINDSLGMTSLNESDLWACFNEIESTSPMEPMLDDVRKN